MECMLDCHGMCRIILFSRTLRSVAVHHTENECGVYKGVHIHFAVNTINFQTGNKWHTNNKESYKREANFNLIIRSFMKEGDGVPLFFR